MTKTTAPFLTAALFALTLGAWGYDSDPGYGPERHWYGVGSDPGGRDYNERDGDQHRGAGRSLVPLYYRPTMRYYGNGFTVSYRYMPVYAQDNIYDGASRGSSNFRTEAFHIATEEIPSWGVNPPRLTVKDPRSAIQPRTAVTSIVRKKGSSKAPTNGADKAPDGGAPAITPPATPAAPTAPPDAAAPVPATAPTAGASAAAPVPALR